MKIGRPTTEESISKRKSTMELVDEKIAKLQNKKRILGQAAANLEKSLVKRVPGSAKGKCGIRRSDPTELLKVIGKRVKKTRLERGLSCRALGEALGMAPKFAAVNARHFEEGKRDFRISTLVILADLLAVPLDYLCGRVDKPGEVLVVVRERQGRKAQEGALPAPGSTPG